MNDSLLFIFLSKKKIKKRSQQKYMIVCRNRDFNKRKIRKIARFIFPELFKKLLGPKIRIGLEHKDYNPEFDEEVKWHEKKHNWEKYPFVALRLIKKKEELHCHSYYFS